jgi:uncharacterized protein YgiM (DUF1202 family)
MDKVMMVRRMLLAVIGVTVIAVLSAAPNEVVFFVRTRQAAVRAEPDPFSKITGYFNHATRVRVVRKQEAWYQVADGQGRGGWMHGSVLTEHPIGPQAGSPSVKVVTPNDEMVIATESMVPVRKKKLDDTWVDRMAAITVSPERMRSFLQEGEVIPPAGGTR